MFRNIKEITKIKSIIFLAASGMISGMINNSQAPLNSAIFSYPDPTKLENIEVRLSGETASGKWKAIGVNKVVAKNGGQPVEIIDTLDVSKHQVNLAVAELYRFFGNQAIMSTFGDHTAKHVKDAITRINAPNMWLDRFANGFPHGGLLVYTDDQKEDLLGYVVAGGSTVPYHAELAISILPEYQSKGYAKSIGEKLIDWAKEVREIGLGNPSKFTAESQADQDLNAQIAAKFRKAFTGKGLECKALEGLYATCSAMQENWSNFLSRLMKPHYYADPYFVTIDTQGGKISQAIANASQASANVAHATTHTSKAAANAASAASTESDSASNAPSINRNYKELITLLDSIIPRDKAYHSIVMPNGEIRTVLRNDAGILKFAYNYPLSQEAVDRINRAKPMQTKVIPTNLVQ